MNKNHWNKVYQEKDIQKVSWYQQGETLSKQLILKYSNPDSKILDCGSGASTLVDELLQHSYKNITLTDISKEALDIVENRLKNNNTGVKIDFITGNILDFTKDNKEDNFDVWHDRAVLHFLTQKDEYEKYFEILSSSVKNGGVAIISTFAPDKIRQCSNLDTKAYDTQTLQKLTKNDWNLLETLQEKHHTPNGDTQLFNYFCLQKKI